MVRPTKSKTLNRRKHITGVKYLRLHSLFSEIDSLAFLTGTGAIDEVMAGKQANVTKNIIKTLNAYFAICN